MFVPPPAPGRPSRGLAASLALHAAALAWLVAGGSRGQEERLAQELVLGIRGATRLVAPPPPVEVRLEDPARRPRVFLPPAPNAPAPPALLPPPVKLPSVEPPQLALPSPSEILGRELPAPPPPVETESEERPKLAFERPAAASAPPLPGAAPLLRPPAAGLEDAIREAARHRFGGVVVGDMEPAAAAGISEFRSLAPEPGRTASNLELLSDPMGVDFRPYLLRMLAAVRRNWMAVMPESARLGRRGRVAIQLAVDRQGRVRKLVIAESSGAEPLDRAAVAAITASDPFAPLPEEFRGEEVRLQFNFRYNMR